MFLRVAWLPSCGHFYETCLGFFRTEGTSSATVTFRLPCGLEPRDLIGGSLIGAVALVPPWLLLSAEVYYLNKC